MSESKKPFRPPGTDLALAREAPWLAPAREQVQRAIAAGRPRGVDRARRALRSPGVRAVRRVRLVPAARGR